MSVFFFPFAGRVFSLFCVRVVLNHHLKIIDMVGALTSAGFIRFTRLLRLRRDDKQPRNSTVYQVTQNQGMSATMFVCKSVCSSIFNRAITLSRDSIT